MHDPFGSLGASGGRPPEDMRPAVDPWETGERVFGIQWDTGEHRALDAEWEAGQQAIQHGRHMPPRRPVGHPRPARQPRPYPQQRAPEHPPYAAPGRARPTAERKGRARLITLLIVVALVAVTGFQTWRLEASNNRLDAVVAAEQERSAQLSTRTEKLEQQLAGVFDPEAVSAGVLPSVFRVRAGEFTGTAFAVGDKAGKGRTNLLTNFHVVESVWESGDREVRLERGGETVTADILKVSRGKDLALLRADKEIRGLAPAEREVKPGQQILVVGAPLGLEDSVTTGVVSAYRPNDEDGQSIQFDAPINPGNSGGPVVNAQDEVVGLATAKARDAEGIGLAVSIRTACELFKVC